MYQSVERNKTWNSLIGPLFSSKPNRLGSEKSTMADALISSICNELTRIISSRIEQEYQLVVGVTEEINKLSSNFLAIQAVLEDAERRQTKEAAVKNWLDKLKQVSYDMDDVLDDWSTAILKSEIQESTLQSKTMVCFPFTGCFSQVSKRHDIALKIKEICQRLDEIVKEKTSYGFDVYRASIEEPERPITTSRVDVPNVRGRDDDKQNLIHKLLSEVDSSQVVVVSIVGAGGIGKTTLAQLAYNDDEVKVHFENMIWICVSEPFNKVNIAREIVQALDNPRAHDPNLRQLDLLLNTISELIEQKRFLLVLDDVWNEKHAEWEPLKLCLQCGAPGSKILVTTRNHNVGMVMGTTHYLPIKVLSNEESWSVFSQLAFSGRSEEECEELAETGRKIAAKAKGLPLAVKVLGGLMQFKRSKEQWQNVLCSNLWELEEVEKGLFPPLLLSYYDLPAAIRICFAYCAVFRKDRIMVKSDLIKRWMAQGYLKTTANKDMELVGEEYFDNLVARSFFQDITVLNNKEDEIEVKMHDIVHDCAQLLSRNECFQSIGEVTMSSSFGRLRARHASLWYPSRQDLDSICRVESLRSLFIKANVNSYNAGALPRLFYNLKHLRSLHLSSNTIKEIPKEVGELTHLRYLNLNGCPMLEVLPQTITKLCNLESLSLYGCTSLKRLPLGMQKLVKLRHLCVSPNLDFLPKGIGSLSSLRTLNYFLVGYKRHEAATMGELEDLNQLEGNLSIGGLWKLSDVGEVVKAHLKKKSRLTALELSFGSWGGGSIQYAMLEALEPPSELESLSISDYRETLFPDWMFSLTKLKQLQLAGTTVDLVAMARLPSLQKLTLERVKIKRSNEGDMSSSAAKFPRLKQLRIHDMRPESEELDIAAAEMPLLIEFQIVSCKKMKDLPDCILTAPKLQKVSISNCPILAEDYKRESGKYWHKISHISQIDISP